MHRLIQLALVGCCLALLAGCTLTATITATETPTFRVELLEPKVAANPAPTVESGGANGTAVPTSQPAGIDVHLVNLVDSSDLYSSTWAIQDRQIFNASLDSILAGLDPKSKLIGTDQPVALLVHPVSIPLSNTLTLYLPGVGDPANPCRDAAGLLWQEIFVAQGDAQSIHLPINELCLYPPGTSVSDLATELRTRQLAPDIILVEKVDTGPILFRFVSQDDGAGAGSVISRRICARLRSDTRIGLLARRYVGC